MKFWEALLCAVLGGSTGFVLGCFVYLSRMKGLPHDWWGIFSVIFLFVYLPVTFWFGLKWVLKRRKTFTTKGGE